jgi:DNA-binding transcriptional regulator YdaS (Cro superfamily)
MPYKFDTSTVRNDKGFCYIIEFSNGVIKPGKTIDLLARFNTHKSDSRKHEIEINRIAFTEQHSGYSETETNMLSVLIPMGVSNVGEYITGVSFSDCVNSISSIGISLTTAKEIIGAGKAYNEQSSRYTIPSGESLVDARNGLSMALNYFGGSQSRLARALAVKPQSVQKWVSLGFIPANRMQEVSIATGIPVTELRPDIFASSQEIDKASLCLSESAAAELSRHSDQSGFISSLIEKHIAEREALALEQAKPATPAQTATPTTQPRPAQDDTEYNIFDFMQGNVGVSGFETESRVF